MVAAYIIPIQVPNTWWPTLFLLYLPCGTNPGDWQSEVCGSRMTKNSQTEQFSVVKYSQMYSSQSRTHWDCLNFKGMNQCSCNTWALWGSFCNILYYKLIHEEHSLGDTYEWTDACYLSWKTAELFITTHLFCAPAISHMFAVQRTNFQVF